MTASLSSTIETKIEETREQVGDIIKSRPANSLLSSSTEVQRLRGVGECVSVVQIMQCE